MKPVIFTIALVVLALLGIGGFTTDASAIAQFTAINNTMEFDCLAAEDGNGNPILDNFFGGTLELAPVPAAQVSARTASGAARAASDEVFWALVLRNIQLMTDPSHCLSGAEPLATIALVNTGALLVKFPEVALYGLTGNLLGVYFISAVFNGLVHQGFPVLTFNQVFNTGLLFPTVNAARIMTLATLGMCIALTHFTTTSQLEVFLNNAAVAQGTAITMAFALGAALTLATLQSFQTWQTGPGNPSIILPIFQYGLYHMLISSMRHPGGWLYAFPALIYATRDVGAQEATCSN